MSYQMMEQSDGRNGLSEFLVRSQSCGFMADIIARHCIQVALGLIEDGSL